jgi:electron transfer flavoprotein beta subunit
LLGVPSLTFARGVSISDSTVRIERQTAGGYDVVEAALPALVSVTSGAVEPRYPTFKGIMQAKQKPIETPTCADLGIEPDVAQSIISVEPVAARAAGEVVEDDGEGHLKIAALLEQVKVL